MTDAGRGILIGLIVSLVLWALLMVGVYHTALWLMELIAG